ncbi:unnamed protein product [Protopolystoma xenopodis]|uniref:G-protein coupled receptors family 1 profile domain-containing protein n=1 Tax=Protopolystoma xenopodis TaxID=117903 RepID=A0A448X0T9_9PLAT|nr:unnamed protein product [Protopolystoma xenopodis]
MAIGLDRLICVQFPIQRHRLTPRAAFRRTLCILAAIWTAAGLGSSIQLYVTRVVTQPDGVVNCSEDWGKDSDRQRVYSIVLFMLIYLIPLSILGITYGIVGRKLWQRRLPGAQVHEQEIMQLKSKRKASGKIL